MAERLTDAQMNQFQLAFAAVDRDSKGVVSAAQFHTLLCNLFGADPSSSSSSSSSVTVDSDPFREILQLVVASDESAEATASSPSSVDFIAFLNLMGRHGTRVRSLFCPSQTKQQQQQQQQQQRGNDDDDEDVDMGGGLFGGDDDDDDEPPSRRLAAPPPKPSKPTQQHKHDDTDDDADADDEEEDDDDHLSRQAALIMELCRQYDHDARGFVRLSDVPQILCDLGICGMDGDEIQEMIDDIGASLGFDDGDDDDAGDGDDNGDDVDSKPNKRNHDDDDGGEPTTNGAIRGRTGRLKIEYEILCSGLLEQYGFEVEADKARRAIRDNAQPTAALVQKRLWDAEQRAARAAAKKRRIEARVAAVLEKFVVAAPASASAGAGGGGEPTELKEKPTATGDVKKSEDAIGTTATATATATATESAAAEQQAEDAIDHSNDPGMGYRMLSSDCSLCLDPLGCDCGGGGGSSSSTKTIALRCCPPARFHLKCMQEVLCHRLTAAASPTSSPQQQKANKTDDVMTFSCPLCQHTFSSP